MPFSESSNGRRRRITIGKMPWRRAPSRTAGVESVVRRFETIKTWATKVLGLDPETADGDACMMPRADSTANRTVPTVGSRRLGQSTARHSPRAQHVSRLGDAADAKLTACVERKPQANWCFDDVGVIVECRRGGIRRMTRKLLACVF